MMIIDIELISCDYYSASVKYNFIGEYNFESVYKAADDYVYNKCASVLNLRCRMLSHDAVNSIIYFSLFY